MVPGHRMADSVLKGWFLLTKESGFSGLGNCLALCRGLTQDRRRIERPPGGRDLKVRRRSLALGMPEKHWKSIGKSRFPWEREALDFIFARFPAQANYLAWSLFEFVTDDGSINEVDALVICPPTCGPDCAGPRTLAEATRQSSETCAGQNRPAPGLGFRLAPCPRSPVLLRQQCVRDKTGAVTVGGRQPQRSHLCHEPNSRRQTSINCVSS